MFDTLIKGGMLLDGTGKAPFRADIALAGGKIAEIKPALTAEAGETIDAAGRYVAPGFVDIHRHADAAVLRPGFGEAELAQGITSIVNGQCGLSAVPCVQPYQQEILRFLEPIIGAVNPELPFFDAPGYFSLLEKQPLPVNVGSCIGNGTLRMAAKGFTGGRLTKKELACVHFHLRAALDAGALGVTMGIVYAPENSYDFDGFIEALAPMREYNVPLAVHIRGYGDLLHPSLHEIIAIARALDVPLHISHMMAVGRRNWGKGLEEALAILDEARKGGMQISCDVYPYTAGSSQLIQILPPWYQEGGVDAIVARLSDPGMRRELAEVLRQPQTKFENLVYASGWEGIRVTTVGSEKNQQHVGKSIAQIAQEQGKTPYDCAFDLLIEERCRVAMVIYITDEKDILRIMRYPHSSIISDSLYPKSGLPHPRLYGSFPKILSEYVRDKKLLCLPEAVQKMTSEPTKLYRIGKKGLLQKGYDADITIFNLDDISCGADYLTPQKLAKGMHRVIVGGKVTWAQEQLVCADAGRLIRRNDMQAG